MRRLNQDANYKQAVGDVIGFRQAGLTRLVKVRVLLPPSGLFMCARPTSTPRLIRVEGALGSFTVSDEYE